MSNKNRIKIAMITNHLGLMGISSVIINYSKALEPQKFEITIIAGSPIADQYRRECKSCGIFLVELPSRHQKPINHYLQLGKVLKKNKYDIVHVHGNSSIMSLELTLARIAGVKVRIAHSHNSTCPNMRLHKILYPYFKRTYTQALACGSLAGEWLFGKNQFSVLPNGFETEKFVFSEIDRKKVRSNLKIEGAFVIGHVGRFNEQKNHEYLLEIFKEVVSIRRNSFLILVGAGPDYKKIKDKINSHPYKDRIILYGESNDVAALYSAMDIFVLPSKYEGLPVVLLEAQISGLPCVVSDRVTHEINFGNIYWNSIEDKPSEWANRILNIKVEKTEKRIEISNFNKINATEYDINFSVEKLSRLYTNIYNKSLKD